jgi:hypothetical protein
MLERPRVFWKSFYGLSYYFFKKAASLGALSTAGQVADVLSFPQQTSKFIKNYVLCKTNHLEGKVH